MITFLVTPDAGEPYKVVATSRDIYTWEKTNHGKTFKTAVESGSIADLTEMAYYAARRQGYFTGKLTEFAGSHDIEASDEDADEDAGDEARPTQPAP